MGHLSVQEISSWLTSRFSKSIKGKKTKDEERPHQSWDDSSRAALVILWGLLVYPRLDPDWSERSPSVELDKVYRLFREHLGSVDQWEALIRSLQRYDYIRFRSDGRVVAGARLWTEIDASRMYPLFRRSVLHRKYDEKLNKDKNC